MKKFKAWLRSSGAQIVVNVSSGKDSTATYLRAIEFGVPFRAVFADTGNEHPIVYEYIDYLPRASGGPLIETVRADFSDRFAKRREYVRDFWPKKGVPADAVERALKYLNPTGNPYLDLCILKARFPSSQAQFCTDELKVIPVEEQILLPAMRQGHVCQWIGVRKDESKRRARLTPVAYDMPGVWHYRPILNWNVDKVFAIHRKHGVKPNPLYSMGMGRVGCMPCINCGKDELRQIAMRFPEQIKRIAEWEHIVGDVSKRHSATFFAVEPDGTEIRPETHGIHTAVDWAMTSRGGQQYDLLRALEPAMCESKYGLCE